jgi:superfamily II DNA or RNA helicase
MQIVINNKQGRITTPLDITQLTVISQMCSFKVEGSDYKQMAFNNKHRGANYDGYRRLFHSGNQTFPIGLLHLILNLLDNCNIGYDIIDNRTHTDPILELKCTPKQIRDYQSDAVMSALMSGGGIIKSATGSGKTTIGAMIIGMLGKPAVFIVHTKDLLEQTIESFENLFGCKIGQIGCGKVDIQPITVATVQTLALASSAVEYEKYKYDEDDDSNGEAGSASIVGEKKKEILDWSHKIGTVIFDEVQRVASRTAYSARFMFTNAEHAFGMSASPWRDDGADLMIEGAFGQKIVDISASELIRQGYLVRPNIIVKKVQNGVWDGKTYAQIYKSAIVENSFRNMQIVQDAIEQYDLGRTTLVLVTQIKHGELLESMINMSGRKAIFISGKSKNKFRSQVIKDMRAGKVQLVIASTIADVGLDVPRITSMVEAGAGKSSVTALQRVGRAIRPFEGKDEAYYITYRDTAPYLNTQIDKKIAIWRTEPEFNIIEEV